jgi:hypothetical protein
LNQTANGIEDCCCYSLPDRGVSGDTMRQSISYLATIAMIAVSYRGMLSPAAMLELSGALSKPARGPVDAFVDWLEASYGGPIGTDDGASRP